MPSSCVVLSIPRSGTHLVMSLLKFLNYTEFFPEVKKNGLLNTFCLPKHNHFSFGAHIHYSKKYLDFMRKREVKAIYITRDIKDVVTSLALYTRDFKNEDGHDLFKTMNTEQQIDYIIKGDLSINFPSIKDRVISNNGWIGCKDTVYTTSFEKLIGFSGGGDNKAQYQEIVNICNHLGIKYDHNMIIQAMSKLYKSHHYSGIIRKGLIGNHKEFLTESNYDNFNEIMEGIE